MDEKAILRWLQGLMRFRVQAQVKYATAWSACDVIRCVKSLSSLFVHEAPLTDGKPQRTQTSSTFHALQTLSLALPRLNTNSNARRRVVPTDLQDCIADYLQEEILRGDNAWRCPTCKSPQVASKRVSIARLPQFL